MAIKTKSCVSVTIEHLPEGGKSDHILQVGSDLWNAVVPVSARNGPIAMSVDLLQTHADNGRNKPSTSLSLTCWAVPSEDVQVSHALTTRTPFTPHSQAATLGIPSDLAKQYPHILGPGSTSRRSGKTHTLCVVQPVPLQEVFVQALSSSAYSGAKSDVSTFEDWLCHGQRILRQDSVLSMDSQDSLDRNPLAYKLIMTEPVLQGYAQKAQTLFTLLPPPEDPPAINGLGNHSSSVPDDAHIEFDDEELEIGESFLAGSLVPQPTLYPQQNLSPTISMPLFAHELTARPSSTPSHSGLDDHTMYVRTVDLPKIGVLDGDWVSASPPASSVRIVVISYQLPGDSQALVIEKPPHSEVGSQ